MSQSIILFRNNLRLQDNQALTQSLKHSSCYPIYISDTTIKQKGAASTVWLYHSLKSLNKA